jgi:hypothetical protein
VQESPFKVNLEKERERDELDLKAIDNLMAFEMMGC